MKFLLKVNGCECVMTYEQLQSVVNVLWDCEKLVDHHVDRGNGTHGYQMAYVHHLAPMSIDELHLRPLTEEKYEATKFVTKMSKEDK